MSAASETRPLTKAEWQLAKWMLENGKPEGRAFLPQLEKSSATMWKCACGCPSFNLKVEGMPEAPPGVHVLGNFFFDPKQGDIAGAFIFSKDDILKGVEIYALAGDPPSKLPQANQLRVWD